MTIDYSVCRAELNSPLALPKNTAKDTSLLLKSSRDAACGLHSSISLLPLSFSLFPFINLTNLTLSQLQAIATMYNGGGTILLQSTSSLRYLGKRIGLSSTVERVPALSNASQSQYYSTILLKPRLTASRLRRTYAQKVVPRAKANTGGATTSATKAAKKPAPKKTTPKSLPKAKSKAKPVKKTTKAKTKAKKPKAKKPKAKKPKVKKTKAKKPKAKKPKKELTAEEKTKKTIKELRAKALKAPPQLVTGAWTLFVTDKLRAAEKVEGTGAQGAKKQFGDTLKAASAAYKELTAEQLEVCLAFERLAPPA